MMGFGCFEYNGVALSAAGKHVLESDSSDHIQRPMFSCGTDCMVWSGLVVKRWGGDKRLAYIFDRQTKTTKEESKRRGRSAHLVPPGLNICGCGKTGQEGRQRDEGDDRRRSDDERKYFA